MFTDDDRRTLYNALEHSLGPAPAAILMAHLPPVGWAELATRGDLVELRGELKGEMAELRNEVTELRGAVHSLLPKLLAANIGAMVGFGGLVLAAVAVT